MTVPLQLQLSGGARVKNLTYAAAGGAANGGDFSAVTASRFIVAVIYGTKEIKNLPNRY